MSTKVAVISQPGEGLHAIRSQLRNPLRYTLREFHSLEDINQHLNEFRFEILLMRVPVFVSAHVQMLARVRQRFPDAGLVMTAPEIDPSARFQARQIPRHKLILEPVEIADLPRVIEKLKSNDPSALRLHARAKREGDVELVDSLGQRVKGRFLDFAQMGARLMVQTRQVIPKNTRLQLHYRSLSEPGRVHRIESVVVWQEVTGGMVDSLVGGPQQMVGLRFIAAL